MRILQMLIVLFVVLGSANLFGHHSFSATYIEEQKVVLHANVVQFYFRNPHSFLMVEAKDSKGEVNRWMVEWDAGGQLGRYGITRQTLHTGDRLEIVGNPARNPTDHRVRMLSVTRPADAWRWSASEQEPR